MKKHKRLMFLFVIFSLLVMVHAAIQPESPVKPPIAGLSIRALEIDFAARLDALSPEKRAEFEQRRHLALEKMARDTAERDRILASNLAP